MPIDDRYYDDPNAALGLGYGYSEVRLSPKALEAAFQEAAETVLCRTCGNNRRTCSCLTPAEERLNDERIKELREAGITDAQKVIPSNAGAHEEFELKARAIFESGEAQSIAEAQRMAREELPDLVHPQSPEEVAEADYLGDSIPNLMAHKSGGKGGGGSSGRTRAKTFPKRCKVADCHLQYCEHLPSRGRKRLADPKTNFVGAKVSKATKGALKEAGLTTSQALEIVATAILTGRTFEEVRLNNPPVTIPKDAA